LVRPGTQRTAGCPAKPDAVAHFAKPVAVADRADAGTHFTEPVAVAFADRADPNRAGEPDSHAH
jgi:hypothetical protein